MKILDELLSIQNFNFQKWQDADVLAVSNLFAFNNEMGNLTLSEVIESIFTSKQLEYNEHLNENQYITSNELDLLDSIIDSYIESGLMSKDPQSFRGTSYTYTVDQYVKSHQVMLYLISLCAIRLHEKLKHTDQFKNFINIMMNEGIIYRTVAKKQMDYGPSNIAKFGIYGLVVRMHDKIGRLRNLIESSKANNVKDETVYDTLVDLVGYCTVAYLWINDWFLLPMDQNYEWNKSH